MNLTSKQQQLMVAVFAGRVHGSVSTYGKHRVIVQDPDTGLWGAVTAQIAKLEDLGLIVQKNTQWASDGSVMSYTFQLTKAGAMEMAEFTIDAPTAIQFGKDMVAWNRRRINRVPDLVQIPAAPAPEPHKSEDAEDVFGAPPAETVTSVRITGLQTAVQQVMADKVKAEHPQAVSADEFFEVQELLHAALKAWAHMEAQRPAELLKTVASKASWLASVIEAKANPEDAS